MTNDTRPGFVGNGALFKSLIKERPSQPDFVGDCEIDGQRYRLFAWIKTDKRARKFLSVGFRMQEPPIEAQDREELF